MRALVFCACLLFCAVGAKSQDQSAILKVLDEQKISWNNGDLEGFMQSYWKSDSLLFVGQQGPEFGWQTTLDNYRKSYPNKEAMGILSFDIKEVRMINSTHAFLLGAWHLKRSKDEPKGFFTLLLRKIDGHWKIIADHSS